MRTPHFRIRFTFAALLWVGVALVVGIVGWWKTINLLMLACYLLLALLGLSVWISWKMVRSLRAVRTAPPITFPGELVVVAAEVHNDGPEPATVSIVDRSADNVSEWLVAPLLPGQSQKLVGRWEFSRRGRYVVEPLLADASYPLGLLHVQREISPPGELIVLPALGHVDLEAFRRWLIRSGAGDANSRRLTRRQAPGQGDFRGLRPYRPGDSPRDVHWKSTVRRGQLVVREYDRNEPLDLLLVLDAWMPENASAQQRTDWEWLLSLAMTLGHAWSESDLRTDLTLAITGSRPLLTTGRATPWFIREAFEPLATLEGDARDQPFPVDLLRRRSHRVARVLLSLRSRCPAAEAFRGHGQPLNLVTPSTPIGWFEPPRSHGKG